MQKALQDIRKKINDDFWQLTSGQISTNEYVNDRLVRIENMVGDLREALNEKVFFRSYKK